MKSFKTYAFIQSLNKGKMKSTELDEVEILEELQLNSEIINIIKSYTYKIKNGKIKHLLKTNLQAIEPTEYTITYPTTLTILEYKVNEISSKPFYIKEYNQKYNLKEIKHILTKLKK